MNIMTKVGLLLILVAIGIAGYEIYYETLTFYYLIPLILSGAILNAFPVFDRRKKQVKNPGVIV